MMYCSACGTETTPGLNYCNRCGFNLNPAAIAPKSEVYRGSLTKPLLIIGATISLISLVGFIALISGALELARMQVRTDPIIAMIVFGMATIMVIDILLIKQLSRFIGAYLQQPAEPAQAKEMPAPRQTHRRLEAARPEAYTSVTENTTRTFEPLQRETHN